MQTPFLLFVDSQLPSDISYFIENLPLFIRILLPVTLIFLAFLKFQKPILNAPYFIYLSISNFRIRCSIKYLQKQCVKKESLIKKLGGFEKDVQHQYKYATNLSKQSSKLILGNIEHWKDQQSLHIGLGNFFRKEIIHLKNIRQEVFLLDTVISKIDNKPDSKSRLNELKGRVFDLLNSQYYHQLKKWKKQVKFISQIQAPQEALKELNKASGI